MWGGKKGGGKGRRGWDLGGVTYRCTTVYVAPL